MGVTAANRSPDPCRSRCTTPYVTTCPRVLKYSSTLLKVHLGLSHPMRADIKRVKPSAAQSHPICHGKRKCRMGRPTSLHLIVVSAQVGQRPGRQQMGVAKFFRLPQCWRAILQQRDIFVIRVPDPDITNRNAYEILRYVPESNGGGGQKERKSTEEDGARTKNHPIGFK